MIKHILIFYVFFCACFVSVAQTGRCGSEEYLNHLKATQPEAYKEITAFRQRMATQQQQSLRTSSSADTFIKIPVVVHVIHNNASGSIGGPGNKNISDGQILSQMTVLNNDYQRLNADSINTPPGYKPIAANVKLQFCLANKDPNGLYTSGITRHYDSQSTYSVSDATKLSNIAYWPSDQYLNIWVCDLSGSMLGFAQPPGAASVPGLGPVDGAAATDGVTIDYKAFGTIGTLLSQYNLGRTTTHEVGHWFGLSHPWGDYNSGDCSLTDYCTDTPPCGNGFESAYPACSNIPTGMSAVVCSPARMIQNYMDYSDDACMNLFTQDQKTRMRTTIEFSTRRYALLSSLGCCTVAGTIAITPYEKSFEDGNITSDDWYTINPNSSSIYTKGFELSSTSAFGNGSYAISVTNDSVYVESDPATHKYAFSYVSPYLNLKTTPSPKLRFNWAYSPLVNNVATDSIVILIAEGCGENWVELQTFYGSGFTSTANPRAFFSPDATEWNTTEINLSNYMYNAGVRIKFVAYSKGINTFYVDNINILQSSDVFVANVFPNPTYDVINIKTLFNGTKTIDYIVYNVLGQLIFKATDENVYSYTKQIDLSSLAAGVYLVQVSDGSKKTVYKIVKQ